MTEAETRPQPTREAETRQLAFRYAAALIENRIPLEGPANRPALREYVTILHAAEAALDAQAAQIQQEKDMRVLDMVALRLFLNVDDQADLVEAVDAAIYRARQSALRQLQREGDHTVCEAAGRKLEAQIQQLQEENKEQLQTISALGLNLKSVMARAEGYQTMKLELEEARESEARLTARLRDLEQHVVTKPSESGGFDLVENVKACFAEVQQLRARLREREWQPIETAEMNRVVLVAHRKGDHMQITVGAKGRKCWIGSFGEITAVAWMPLPDPPAREGTPDSNGESSAPMITGTT